MDYSREQVGFSQQTEKVYGGQKALIMHLSLLQAAGEKDRGNDQGKADYIYLHT